MTAYDIRVCREADVDRLTRFLHQYWQANHVLSRSRALLDWQYRDSVTGDYNFFLACLRNSGEIIGILGFIPTGQFDRALGSRDIWLSIWKVREDLAPPGLGFALLSFLKSKLKPVTVGAIGLSDTVMPIYQALKYQTGTLTQWVLPNRAIQADRLISGVPEVETRPAGSTSGHCALSQCDGQRLAQGGYPLTLFQTSPQKSHLYLVQRYLNHPIYRYRCWQIEAQGEVVALFVTRDVVARAAKALRVVDFLGPIRHLCCAADSLRGLIKKEEAEYLDVLLVDDEQALMTDAGFIDVSRHPNMTVPHYYEPFVADNVVISWAYQSRASLPYRIVKGDSDQDRPNQLPDD